MKKKKNSAKKAEKRAAVKADRVAKRRKKIFIGIIAFIAAAAIIFGITMGIIIAVKNSRSVVRYNGQRIDASLASFFASSIKPAYIQSLIKSGYEDARDELKFWYSYYDEEAGIRHIDKFEEFLKNYLSRLVVAAALYDRYAANTSSDKEIIEMAVSEVLDYKADGNIDNFNLKASKYGFDYKTLKEAAKLIYKAQCAKAVIYGSDGSGLASFPEECEKYLATYSHVSLMFIRTEDTFKLDAYGDRVTDEDGNYILVPLTAEEKEEKVRIIDEMRRAIAAGDSGGDMQISPVMFDKYLRNYSDSDKNMYASGYYFNVNSDYTASAYAELPEVVKKSLEMPVDSYAEVATDFGVCFIYKSAPVSGMYSEKTTEDFFTDFYTDAADYLFEESVNALIPEVIINEELFNEGKYTFVPMNSDLVPRF